MQRKIIFILFVLISTTSTLLFAQREINNCPIAIYFKKDTFYNNKCDTTIKDIYFNIIANKIIIVYKKGTKGRFIPDEVFGYTNAKGQFYRVDNNDKFELRDKKQFYFYSRKSGKGTNYYFSKQIDSKLFRFTKKNLYLQYDSTTVKKILDNKYYKRKL